MLTELRYSYRKENRIQTAIEYYAKALEIAREDNKKIKHIKQSHTWDQAIHIR